MGEHVVELASPFSTQGIITCVGVLAEGAMVHVEIVLVEPTVERVDRAVEAVMPVDLRVGVTVADGFVNAAGLPSLSTRGLMGTVAEVAAVPALFGSGSGRPVNCFKSSPTGRLGKSRGLT